jgi:hypothetical protein
MYREVAMESVLIRPYDELQAWVNGHVIIETEKGHNSGTLLSLDYDGVIVRGEIVIDDGKRVVDIFIPFRCITAMAFTADATEPRPSTLPEYVPGRDNWAGETR